MAPVAPEQEQAAGEALDRLRAAARLLAPAVDVRIAAELAIDALTELVTSTGIDLVAVGAHERAGIALVGELRKRAAVAVLYLPDGGSEGPYGLFCVGLSARERWIIASFLAAHATTTDRASLLSGVRLSDQDIRQIRSIAGITVDVQRVDGDDLFRRI